MTLAPTTKPFYLCFLKVSDKKTKADNQTKGGKEREKNIHTTTK